MSKDLSSFNRDYKRRGMIKAIPHYLRDTNENLALRIMMGAGIFSVLDDPAAACMAAITAVSVVFPPLTAVLGALTTVLGTIAIADNVYVAIWAVMMILIFGKKINEHRYLK